MLKSRGAASRQASKVDGDISFKRRSTFKDEDSFENETEMNGREREKRNAAQSRIKCLPTVLHLPPPLPLALPLCSMAKQKLRVEIVEIISLSGVWLPVQSMSHVVNAVSENVFLASANIPQNSRNW